MRTLAEMITRVRTLVRDADDGNSNSEWTDAEITALMTDANEMLASKMASDPRANDMMRTVSAPVPTRQYVSQMAIPADCLEVNALKSRTGTTLYASLTTGTVTNSGFAGGAGDWDAVTSGTVIVVMDDRKYLVEDIDLSSTTTETEVATALQVAIRAVTNAAYTVTWSATDSQFTFSCYDKIMDVLSASSFLRTGDVDLSGSGYLNALQAANTLTHSLGTPSWRTIVKTPSYESVVSSPTSGTTLTYGSYSMGGGKTVSWNQGDMDGYVELDPAPTTTSDLIKFVYYRQPAFPSADESKFFGVPEGYDVAIEYLTSAFVAQEELEDGLPIGALGREFAMRYNVLVGARLGGIGKKRRSIRVTGN